MYNTKFTLINSQEIYPEHKNHEHDRGCSRYRAALGEPERHTAYVMNDEDGRVTTYFTFNPKNF